MAEADLSKIVGLIMENPKLIEEIKGLTAKSENEESGETASRSEAEPEIKIEEASAEKDKGSDKRMRRKELLHALKAYVSEERGRAIESMLSIADILDMMKTR